MEDRSGRRQLRIAAVWRQGVPSAYTESPEEALERPADVRGGAGRRLASARPDLDLDQSQDHVAVVFAGAAQAGELVAGRPLDPDLALALGIGLDS